MQTEINNLLEIEYPIIQGGMAWVAEHHLAAAVSEAGGFGLIGAANAPADWVREQIRKTKELTDRPFGVNVMLMSPYADEVVAEGCESGGHIGESTTMTLVPQVVDAVDIPVIAAGGIGDGRGIAAAFMLGAKGVQMGTRFVVTNECQVHPAYKERIIRAKDIDTRVTGRSTGHPIRALRNDMTKAYLQKEQEGASTEELELLASGALRRAVQEGDIHNGSLMSGQIAGLIKEEVSCKQLIDTLVSQTKEALNRSRMYE